MQIRVLLVDLDRPEVVAAVEAAGHEVVVRRAADLSLPDAADVIAGPEDLDEERVHRALGGSGPPILRDRGPELAQAVLRLAAPLRWPELVRLGSVTVDLAGREVTGEEGPTGRLTDKEAQVLGYLVRHAGRAVSRDELLGRVWGYSGQVLTRTVDTTMRRLRAKVEADPVNPTWITTVYGVGYRLEGTVAAVAPAAAVGSRLPEEASSFVGRARELEQIRAAFAEGARLVTLSGGGGTGKTRLSLRFARSQPLAWFCDLSEVRTVTGIVHVVSNVLDVPLIVGHTTGDAVHQLGNALARRGPCLVVLDNFEQAVEHAADCVPAWLAMCPEARFLVTSRERLRIEGELALAIDPLVQDEAVALFLDRARRVQPGWGERSEDAAVVRAIAARLDRIPLALELAAARANVLDPAQLSDRLGDRFPVLSLGRRDAAERHATLQNALDWSWELLEPTERAALAQVSVFRGGFTLEAAEMLLGLEALDRVQALVDKSLLRSRSTGSGLRFGLFQYVRAYAAQKLAEGAHGSEEEARARHRDGFAARAAARLEHLGALDALTDIARDLENYLAAWDYGKAARAERLLPVVEILDALMFAKGPFDAHLQLLDDAVAHTAELGPGPRARLLVKRGDARRVHGRMEDAGADLTLALRLCRDLDDARTQAEVHSAHGMWALRSGDVDRALSDQRRAQELARSCGARALELLCTQRLGVIEMERGALVQAVVHIQEVLDGLHHGPPDGHVPRGRVVDYGLLGHALTTMGNAYAGQSKFADAEAAYRRALDLNRRIGSVRTDAQLLIVMGNLELIRGRRDRARALYSEALDSCRQVGQLREEGICRCNLGWLLVEDGDLPGARVQLRAALRLQREVASPRNVGIVLGNLGALSHLEGRLEEAVAHLEEAVEILGERDLRAAAYMRCYLAAAQADLGLLEPAEAVLAEAEALGVRTGDPTTQALLSLSRGHLDAARGDLDGARSRAEEVRRTYAERAADVDRALQQLEALVARLGREGG